jgi:hypothetical protein
MKEMLESLGVGDVSEERCTDAEQGAADLLFSSGLPNMPDVLVSQVCYNGYHTSFFLPFFQVKWNL